MSTEELINTILNVPTESRTLEFKRLGSRNESIEKVLQSIVAMANTDGGTIILGVDDPQKTTFKGFERILGIEENISLYDELGQAVKKISPPITGVWPPDLIPVPERNVRIGLVTVPKVGDGFRSIENHVYIRQERGNKRLTPQEIVHFAYVKGFERADKELVSVDLSLLHTSYYETWRRKRSIGDDSIGTVLEKTGLARKGKGGQLLPTRAAVLLFAEFPSDLVDTKCAIRVFQYEGNLETVKETLNLIGTPKNIVGPVIKQIADAHDYVLTLLRTGIRVPSGFVATYQIPERAVKEAITNAVIHRDYYTKRDIEVRIFEDRVEVESPGLFPFNITPSNIGIERAYGYRNDLIVKHLREFPDSPNLDQNEGVRAMRNQMRAGGLYPPIFWTYPRLQDGVRVVLLNEKVATEWEKVSECLERTKYITNEDARKITGVIQRDRMTKLLKNWVRQGLLIQIVPPSGYVKGTKYRLSTTRDLGKP